MSGGHFGSTFHTYALQPQAQCKNQMYGSVKNDPSEESSIGTNSLSLFSGAWIGASLSWFPLTGIGVLFLYSVKIQSTRCARSMISAISEGRPGTSRHFRRMPGVHRDLQQGQRRLFNPSGSSMCSLSDSVSTEPSVSDPDSLDESVHWGVIHLGRALFVFQWEIMGLETPGAFAIESHFISEVIRGKVFHTATFGSPSTSNGRAFSVEQVDSGLA